MSAQVCLYKHFDESGNLLYVGVSNRPNRRWLEHQALSHWADQVRNITVQWHNSRDEALAAERKAIIEDCPKYNKRCGQRFVPTEAGKLLDEIGRDRVASVIGVDMRRINCAALEEKLPALWWAAMCDLTGRKLPFRLFTFKGMAA